MPSLRAGDVLLGEEAPDPRFTALDLRAPALDPCLLTERRIWCDARAADVERRPSGGFGAVPEKLEDGVVVLTVPPPCQRGLRASGMWTFFSSLSCNIQ